MPRPGVDVTIRESPTPITIPSDTGTWFIAGLSDRGSAIQATLLQSLSDAIIRVGDRQTYSPIYDALELGFNEGLFRVYFARVVGPGATTGFKNLLDSGSAVSLVATANGPGAWSAGYKVGVVAGGASGTYQILVTDSANNVLEQSADLATPNAGVLWSAQSRYIRLALGASSLNPAPVAAAALSAGNDDRSNITDAQWAAALTQFTDDLGPGQVSFPGRTTDTAHAQLLAHSVLYNRKPILDPPDTATEATLYASVAAARTAGQRNGAVFAPWVVIPGIVAGTTRAVPPSAAIAGLIARNDPVYGTNTPSAGKNGILRTAIDLTQPTWDDLARGRLNSGSVNVIRRRFNGIQVYGWRSLVDPITDPNWVDWGNSRQLMKLTAEYQQVGEDFEFADIDGQNGTTITAFHGELVGVAMEHWRRGELFGDTAEEAFSVDTGPTVNTLERLQALELHAIVSFRMSPFAEWTSIELVKRLLTQAVAA